MKANSPITHYMGEVKVRNSYVNMRLNMKDIIAALTAFKQRTGAATAASAIELSHFDYATLTSEEKEWLGMLVTLTRCMKDGNVDPDFNIQELYGVLPLPA